jgi:uncharacterized protein
MGVRRTLVPLSFVAALTLLACKPEPAPASDVPPDAALVAPESAPSDAQPSYWLGSLALPNDQHLDWAISIAPAEEQGDGDAQGEFEATLWIPQQMVIRMPVGAPAFHPDGSISVALGIARATWTITPGDPPRCSFEQAGATIDCNLEAVSAAEFDARMRTDRPQNPKPPFPYAIEQVQIKNPSAPEVTLAGTLTIPEGAGPHPGVVMITGSGLQDRDETILDHKPFWIIADHLSRNGVAVLRYDDRGYAKSTGDGTTATLADFATDAHAAIVWLAGHDAVDGERVGFVGHSEGGMIAPLIAAEHPDQVDFMVLLAGSGVIGSEIIVHQLGLIMKGSGVDDATVEREQKAARAQHRALLDSPPTEAKAALERAIRASIDELPAAEREALGDVDSHVATKVAVLSSPWMAHFLGYDPIPALKRVRVPVLVLAGDKDLQVDPEQNLGPMKAALANNPAAKIVRFADLNHLFQPADKGTPDEYGTIEQTIAVEVLETMTSWLRATAGLE